MADKTTAAANMPKNEEGGAVAAPQPLRDRKTPRPRHFRQGLPRPQHPEQRERGDQGDRQGEGPQGRPHRPHQARDLHSPPRPPSQHRPALRGDGHQIQDLLRYGVHQGRRALQQGRQGPPQGRCRQKVLPAAYLCRRILPRPRCLPPRSQAREPLARRGRRPQGYLPFQDQNIMAMYKKIYKGEFRCPRWFSTELIRLLTRLLDTNPETRITIPEIMNNRWFKKGFKHIKFYIEDDKLCSVREEDDDVGSESDQSLSESESEVEIQRRTTSLPRPASLNAFDIISFSPGFDLSGLFDEGGEGGEKIFELTPSLRMVEVKKKGGDKGEYDDFYNRELKPGLQNLKAEESAASSHSLQESSNLLPDTLHLPLDASNLLPDTSHLPSDTE
ncbi:CBL-interacting protein kinase 12 [Actinidia rufa]|uniref:non-specific serine/threonine protein kinase n=1 Tax=Actinidia rufa TaxID=165716 RepID=A0A7J0ER20_9ERIC|nr:CBL-interacting protein kinase 12 [Actinidia rufa]